MKAIRYAWLGFALMLAWAPAVTVARQSSQSPSAQASQQSTASPDQKAKPAPAKTAKVWTEDDISSVRTPTDNYMDQEQTQAAAATAAATQKPHAAANAAKPDQPPMLSNPKTVADADKMIAWEQRDIDSQQEYLEKLQKQVEDAPPDQRAHLQDWIAQEIKTIADTRREMEGLQTQKKDLEKKAAASSGSAQQQQHQ
ncbi:MAG TPA: hypothetical protein VGT03_00510 [Candidatus Acidoferrales bacterium]|nr:hypothetical protein [Candidatus Acidoferrales bacterium]